MRKTSLMTRLLSGANMVASALADHLHRKDKQSKQVDEYIELNENHISRPFGTKSKYGNKHPHKVAHSTTKKPIRHKRKTTNQKMTRRARRRIHA